MAHNVINGKVVIDWLTGDPEGDRLVLLAAYRDFIKEINECFKKPEGVGFYISEVFEKWQIDTENQIDNVPRIWIKRPK